MLIILFFWFVYSFNIKPLQINAQINQAEHLIENGRCDLALEKMEKISAKKSVLDGYFKLNYAGFLIKCREAMPEQNLLLLKKAQQLGEEFAEIHPYYIRNYIMLGSLINFRLEQEEDPATIKQLKEKAGYYLELAHQLSPGRQEVFAEWIKNDLITGQYQKAKDKSQQCLALNEKSKDCWWLKGLSNIYLKEPEQSKENIEKAGKLGFPVNSEDSLLKLAKAYFQIENYQAMVQIYQDLIKLRPEEPEYRVSLMLVYKEIKDFESAKKQALAIIELFPEYKTRIEEFLKQLP